MAVDFVIDTSAYSEFGRKNQKMEKYINEKNNIYVPLIVVGELKAGFLNGSKPEKNLSLLNDFLDAPNVTILKLGEKTTDEYACIYISLKLSGTPMGTNDMWIAAQCLEHKLPLISADSDFKRVKELKLLD